MKAHLGGITCLKVEENYLFSGARYDDLIY